ncbi:MAG: TRAP transporter substrate-binding protein [Planctomycetota bacterium]|jgi:tripartite ATP-independent transporter DctP family solute receptor|nr:TRAP transporter substrate-binding protein [Planctomycetota bacterium]
MIKKYSLLVAATACFLLIGVAAAGQPYRVIFGNYFGPTHPNTKMMERFRERLEKESNGAFRINLKPNNEIGGEEKLKELVKRGTIQIAMLGGTAVKDDEPMLAAWDQPYVIDGWDHARAVFFDPEVKRFHGKYEDVTKCYIQGYVVNGFRVISCNFSLNSMADIRRMKLRVPLNEVLIKVFEGLGTNPTPMPMTELYTALETKVVDGQDNPYSTVKAMGWWEVQPYMLDSRHSFSVTNVVVNGKFYDGLPADLRKLFDEALADAIEYSWSISEDDENESIAFLESNGIKIVFPDDDFKRQMIDSQTKVYEWMDANIPGNKEFREFCRERR